MSVPKNTTPRPFSSYRRDDDNTPAWIEPVRRDTPGYAAQQQRPPRDYGRPAKKTMAYKPKYHPEQDARPVELNAMFFTRELCWDCNGDGKSGAILYRCPVCGEHWPWAQIERHASQYNHQVRDQWGAVYLPCSDHCGRIPTTRLYKIHEACPTCKGLGYRDIQRSLAEILRAAFEYNCKQLGINNGSNNGSNDATLPTPAAAAAASFQQSEPTAPSAPLEHPAVHAQPRMPERFTPHVAPLAPDELKEF